MSSERPIALLSVSDKTGLPAFARRLDRAGFELVSTGGTLEVLLAAGLPATAVSDLTGFPEILDGRVKTLHPAVHAGILFRREWTDDVEVLQQHHLRPIDLVVVNLYPFEATTADPDVTLDAAVEQIDIGGPTLVRAAAKNHAHVGVVTDPGDYDAVAEALEASQGRLPAELRRALALKAFEHTAAYDAAIAEFFRRRFADDVASPRPRRTLALHSAFPLRYGENPHQSATLYAFAGADLLGGARSLQGKPLSYNNLLDLDAAIHAVAEHEGPAAVIVKHTNPCGVGLCTSPDGGDADLVTAYRNALAGDPMSAFGGIVALNRPCDAAVARLIAERFYEVVTAPAFTEEARGILAAKRRLRLVEGDPVKLAAAGVESYRSTALGLLVQSKDPPVHREDPERWRVVTQVAPSDEQMAALRFLWKVCKHVRSNAIVIGSAHRTFGIGAGQMSRVDAVEIAIDKSTGGDQAACLASDAFFPFRDSIDRASQAGIVAIVQPGGSRRDNEVVEAADEHGIPMVFTGRRHFRH